MNNSTTGSYQHCKEIAQETCYNRPSAGPKPEQVSSEKGEKMIGALIESLICLQVTLMVPTPTQDCGPQQITIPTVQCQDITEEKYKKILPSIFWLQNLMFPDVFNYLQWRRQR